MRIVRSADSPRTPWKNGGGETTQIAISPAGASLEDFDWRVSTAQVASDGPFSVFPGIDRHLAILDGAGIVLERHGHAATTLTREMPPYVFPGDILLAVRLIDGPIVDLNVMTRRGHARASLSKIETTGRIPVAAQGDVLVLVVHGADATLGRASETWRLAPGDCVCLAKADGSLWLEPGGSPTLYRIDIWSERLPEKSGPNTAAYEIDPI
jgi:uncharacterized protein